MPNPFKVHQPGCPCCGETAICNLYMDCCINSVQAFWRVQDSQVNPGLLGITLSAHVENLCESGPGGLGDDWSEFIQEGSSFRKMYATSLAGALQRQNILSRSDGCNMNLDIKPTDLVCTCNGPDNFLLSVDVFNCAEQPVNWWWYVESSELCFSVGNPYPDPEFCCLQVSGYQVDNGILIRSPIDDDFPVPLAIPGEDSVNIKAYFQPNLNCAICVDDTQIPLATHIAWPSYPMTDDDTPKKPCYERVCDKPAEGDTLSPVPEVYDDCEDCAPAPSFPTRFDNRLNACNNCYWAQVEEAGWGSPLDLYGIDDFCKCGCPTCSTRRTEVDCIPPSTLGPQRSDTGSANICASYQWNVGGTNAIWHGINGDGCINEIQLMSTHKYVGPCGAVEMNLADMGAVEFNNWQTYLADTQEACDVIPISWDTSAPDGGGGVTVTMSVAGFNASRYYPTPSCSASRDIHWQTDLGC